MTVVRNVVQDVVKPVVGSVSGGSQGLTITQQQIIDLYGGSQPGFIWDLFDDTRVFQDRSATPLAAAGDGDDLGTILDAAGNSNHAIAPSDAARQLLVKSGDSWWAQHDGVDDSMRVASFSSSVLMRFYGVVRTSDTKFLSIQGDGALEFAGVTESGSASSTYMNAGTVVSAVNRTLVSPHTRDGLHDALVTGSARILELRQLDQAAWTSINQGAYSNFEFLGDWGSRILIPESVVATSANDKLCYNFLAERYGVSLI